MRNIPIVTKNLLIVNVVAFLLTFLMGKDASGGYALNDDTSDSISFWLPTFKFISSLLTCLCMEVSNTFSSICLPSGCLAVW